MKFQGLFYALLRAARKLMTLLLISREVKLCRCATIGRRETGNSVQEGAKVLRACSASFCCRSPLLAMLVGIVERPGQRSTN